MFKFFIKNIAYVIFKAIFLSSVLILNQVNMLVSLGI